MKTKTTNKIQQQLEKCHAITKAKTNYYAHSISAMKPDMSVNVKTAKTIALFSET